MRNRLTTGFDFHITWFLHILPATIAQHNSNITDKIMTSIVNTGENWPEDLIFRAWMNCEWMLPKCRFLKIPLQSYSVTQFRRNIGLRVAFGKTTWCCYMLPITPSALWTVAMVSVKVSAVITVYHYVAKAFHWIATVAMVVH